jgi:LacI family transcriptional regulator
MTKPVRLIDVAKASKSSIKTVSRVLNNDPRVSDSTRKRVQKKMDELGYQVDLIARSLRTGVDNVIGLVIQKIGDSFFAEVAEEIEIEANTRGFGVIIGSTHGEIDREMSVVQGFKQRRVAGMIITPQDVDYSIFKNISIPTVFIDRAPNNFDGDIVRVDDEAGGLMATEHLIAHSHKKIAFFGDRIKIQTSKLRLDGYKKALKQAKIKIDDELIILDLDSDEKAEDAVAQMLANGTNATAIFAAKSELGVGIVRALHKANRTDIAIISFDDFRLADTLQPAISILDHSPRTLGRAAINRLLNQIDGIDSATKEEILPLSVVPRGSGEIKPQK